MKKVLVFFVGIWSFLVAGLAQIPSAVQDAFRKASDYLYVNEDSCTIFCDYVYDWAVRHRETELEADVLLLKAEVLFYKGDIDAVMEICGTVKEMAQRNGNRALWLRSLLLEGRSYMEMDRFDKAYSSLVSAKEMFVHVDDSTLLPQIYNAFGVLYDLQGQGEKALDCYKRGLALSGNSLDPLLRVRFLNNISIIYTNQGRFEEAKALLCDCIGYVSRKRIAFGLDRLYMNIVPIYIGQDEVDSALFYVEKSLDMARAANNGSSMARSLIYKGYIYYMKAEWDSANRAFEDADAWAVRMGYDHMHCMILRYQAWVAEGRKDYVAAYRYLESYIQKSDSLEHKRNVANMLRMQMEKEAEQAGLEAQYRIYRLMAVVGGMVLVVVALVLAFGFRLHCSKRKFMDVEDEKRSLESDLEQENKRQITRSIYKQKKDKDLEDVIRQLRESKPYFKPSNQPLIERVIFSLEQCVQEEPWADFEMRFEKVHTGFFKNLSAVYPGLTVHEKRLCAYLRLDMTTKEIASLIHSSPRAVEQARYRLRKSLGLGRNEDLVAFLSKFD